MDALRKKIHSDHAKQLSRDQLSFLGELSLKENV